MSSPSLGCPVSWPLSSWSSGQKAGLWVTTVRCAAAQWEDREGKGVWVLQAERKLTALRITGACHPCCCHPGLLGLGAREQGEKSKPLEFPLLFLSIRRPPPSCIWSQDPSGGGGVGSPLAWCPLTPVLCPNLPAASPPPRSPVATLYVCPGLRPRSTGEMGRGLPAHLPQGWEGQVTNGQRGPLPQGS